jgi:replicative DNA helicase
MNSTKNTNTQNLIPIDKLLTNMFEKIDERHHNPDRLLGGLPTGFSDLDTILNGLHPGELIIVSGRPQMGKTVFASNIALHAALVIKKPVLIFYLENKPDFLIKRLISSVGRIDMYKVLSGSIDDEDKDWSRLAAACSLLNEAPLFFVELPCYTPNQISQQIDNFIKENNTAPGLIMIDFLQRMHADESFNNRYEEISSICRSLKNLAINLNAPFLVTSQVNRKLEERVDKRPLLSDLRDSGCLEEEADTVLFIYRDEVYDENTPWKGVSEIIVAKHRHGGYLSKVRLIFLKNFCTFDNFMKLA